jgi:Bacterial PH domain/Short C-terminal domain
MAVDQHLQSGEEVLYRAHPSRIPLVLPLAAAALVVVAAAGTAYALRPDHQALVWMVALIPLLLFLGVAGVRYLRLLSREYILTNQRLVQQEGLLGKRSIDSYLGKINNIEYAQSFWGRLLGYGDLKIDTANAAEPAIYPNLADPLGFKRAISAAADALLAAGNRAAPPPPPPPAPAPLSGAERLRQLKALFDDGLLSQAEFDAKRQKLLDEI